MVDPPRLRGHAAGRQLAEIREPLRPFDLAILVGSSSRSSGCCGGGSACPAAPSASQTERLTEPRPPAIARPSDAGRALVGPPQVRGVVEDQHPGLVGAASSSHWSTVRFAWSWSMRAGTRGSRWPARGRADPVGRRVRDASIGRSIRGVAEPQPDVAARSDAFACQLRCSSRRSARNERRRAATSLPDSPPGHASVSGSGSHSAPEVAVRLGDLLVRPPFPRAVVHLAQPRVRLDRDVAHQDRRRLAGPEQRAGDTRDRRSRARAGGRAPRPAGGPRR